MCETSSSGSWYGSGSVDTFQPWLPAAMSAARTWAGVASGRDALYSATAPVTCGAAIEVPERYANPPGTVDQMHFPGAMMSTSPPKFEKFANVSSRS